MSEIALCPFCGGTAETTSETAWMFEKRILRATVYCTSCEVRGPQIILDPYTNSFAHAEELAIAIWNQRFSAPDRTSMAELMSRNVELITQLAEQDARIATLETKLAAVPVDEIRKCECAKMLPLLRDWLDSLETKP